MVTLNEARSDAMRMPWDTLQMRLSAWLAGALRMDLSLKPALYVRDHGVLCYAALLFRVQDVPDELPEDLQSTGLSWWWQSTRERTVGATGEVRRLPERRPLLPVTTATGSTFLADLRERDAFGEGRSLIILGFDRPPEEGMTAAWARQALAAFAAEQPSPIRIVVLQLPDGPYTHLFVPHAPAPAVRGLLDRWGLIPQIVRKRRPYSWLHGLRIELLIDEIAHHLTSP